MTGCECALRVPSFPTPVAVACNVRAVAQRAFLLQAESVRGGATGAFKIGPSEVAIGLTIPHHGVELARMGLPRGG